MEDHAEQGLNLVHAFVDGRRSLSDTLTGIAELGTAALATDMAGLTLNDEFGRAATVVYTDGMVPEIDQAQYDNDEGPCLQASRDRASVVVSDTASDRRFPAYADAALRHGVHASFSVPVIVGRAGVGALNFYDRRPGYFDESPAAGEVFARQSAIVAAYYDRAEVADTLQRAIESRATIDQAKGILMASTGCSADEAFDLLRDRATTEGRRLRDVGAEIVAQQGPS